MGYGGWLGRRGVNGKRGSWPQRNIDDHWHKCLKCSYRKEMFVAKCSSGSVHIYTLSLFLLWLHLREDQLYNRKKCSQSAYWASVAGCLVCSYFKLLCSFPVSAGNWSTGPRQWKRPHMSTLCLDWTWTLTCSDGCGTDIPSHLKATDLHNSGGFQVNCWTQIFQLIQWVVLKQHYIIQQDLDWGDHLTHCTELQLLINYYILFALCLFYGNLVHGV